MRIRLVALVPLVLASLVMACGGDDDDGGGDGGGVNDPHVVVQQGCTDDAECPGGRCVEGLPGGLCTRDCQTHEECPVGTVCTDTEAVDGVCLFECVSSDECLENVGTGYVCDSETNLTTGEDILVCIDSV